LYSRCQAGLWKSTQVFIHNEDTKKIKLRVLAVSVVMILILNPTGNLTLLHLEIEATGY
jgi:hypothetical protein